MENRAGESRYEWLELNVTVAPVVPSEVLDPDDDEVAGIYAVRVPAMLPEGVQVGLALDAFHESVGIACLDDFEIEVVNPLEGKTLNESDGYESNRDKLGLTGEFLGYLEAMS